VEIGKEEVVEDSVQGRTLLLDDVQFLFFFLGKRVGLNVFFKPRVVHHVSCPLLYLSARKHAREDTSRQNNLALNVHSAIYLLKIVQRYKENKN